MDKITHEVRLRHWQQVIEQCQSRPEWQTAKDWMADNGINPKTYYYWLRKVRQKVYNEATAAEMAATVNERCPTLPVQTCASEKSSFLPVQAVQSEHCPVQPAQTDLDVSFAEIPYNPEPEPNTAAKTAKEESGFQATAVVKAGNASIEFNNAASAELLAAILHEVLGNA